MFKSLKYLVLTICFIPSMICAHFDLEDFKGSFIFYGYSNSGVTALDGEELVPVSQTNVSQVTFDNHGVGEINFFSLSILPFGQTISTNNCPPNTTPFNVKLNLLNKSNGSGNLVITGVTGDDSVIVYDFIAMKKKGKVTKIYGHVNYGTSRNPNCVNSVTGTLPPIISSLLFGKRQY